MPVPLSINISTLNLYRQDFIERVCVVPKKYQVPENLITLELSEEAALDHGGALPPTVTAFKDHGFRLAIGSSKAGAASLSLPTGLPLDIIKMLSDFLVSSLFGGRSRNIVSDFLRLAGSLGISVIATGVERPEKTIADLVSVF